MEAALQGGCRTVGVLACRWPPGGPERPDQATGGAIDDDCGGRGVRRARSEGRRPRRGAQRRGDPGDPRRERRAGRSAVHARDARLLRPAPDRPQGRAQVCATTSAGRACGACTTRSTSPSRAATDRRTAAARTPARCTGRSSGSSASTPTTRLRRRRRTPGSARFSRCWWRRRQKEPFEDGETRYSCQATEMLRAAPQRLPLKDVSQYREDVASRQRRRARGRSGRS